MPFKGPHWKYRTPATEPSFLPMGSSRTIPAHWPGANWVSPRNWMNPGLFPFTQTRSPTRKSSTNSSWASEEGALDAFSLGTGFSTGAAPANRREDQKRFNPTLEQTAPNLKAMLPKLSELVRFNPYLQSRWEAVKTTKTSPLPSVHHTGLTSLLAPPPP